MPEVRIEPSGAVVRLAPGERLLDALDSARSAAVPFSCRDASCGSCRVAVVTGAGAFEAAGPPERATLAALGASPAERLACQLVARVAPAGEIVLEVARSPT